MGLGCGKLTTLPEVGGQPPTYLTGHNEVNKTDQRGEPGKREKKDK